MNTLAQLILSVTAITAVCPLPYQTKLCVQAEVDSSFGQISRESFPRHISGTSSESSPLRDRGKL